MSVFKKSVAEREKVKLMLGITGVAGAGKTYSALQLAYGITNDWSKIALADTENRSALYYAGNTTGPWQHIEFPSTIPQGYHPLNWIKLIEEVEADPNIEVLVLDSISHEWQGTGGCTDIADAIGKGSYSQNSFTAWKTVTPLHRKFIDKMRESRLNIIATMRRASDYSMDKNEKGKTTPTKVGLKSLQRDGTDYEFGIIFDIEINHMAEVSKDRTNLFKDRGPFMITPSVGKELLEWAQNKGEIYQAMPQQRKRFGDICVSHQILDKDAMKKLSDECIGKPFDEIEGHIIEATEKVYPKLEPYREDYKAPNMVNKEI